MILRRDEIQDAIAAGTIVIAPFSAAHLSPTSYSYHLGDEIIEQPPDGGAALQHVDSGAGILLRPGRLYLSHTRETIGSQHYVTLLSGLRATARLGLFVQLSANLGNLGDAHQWTLELSCVQPVVVYAGMVIGQLTFWRPQGDIELYSGPYTRHSRPVGNLRTFN
jgi:dCTP deaminase